MRYKESRYNHRGALGDKVFLYNLVTSSVALLDTEEYEQISKEEFSSSEVMEMAVENGFIVPYDEDEIEKILAIQRMNNFSTRFAGFQILPTTTCNARCFYCYEHSYKPEYMNQVTADSIPTFIEGYMDMVDDIHVTWFGGEPLLELDRIVSLSGELMSLSEKHGVRYTSDMITNGSLADRAIVHKLVKQCGISQVQITLDGLEDEYLRRKAYLSKEVTFETIMETMDSFVEYGAQLLIRLNIDKDNFEDCLRLISILGERYNDLDSVMLYAAPLYGTSDCSGFFVEEELDDAYRAVFRAMIDAGFIQTLDGLPLNFNNATCSAQMINNFVITPTGDVFKCEHLLADESQRVGTVFDGIIFNEAMVQWTSPDIPEKCRTCGFLPSCQAGCFAAEALQFGLKRCPHIAYITAAIIDAAGYLLDNHGERTTR